MSSLQFLKGLNRYSKNITASTGNGAAQAMLYALGLSTDDLQRPQVGIGAVQYDSNPCNAKLDILSDIIKSSLTVQGIIPFRFSSVGVSDGISMGTSGMNYSLPSRDLIADNFETICQGHHYDSLIAIPGCDKNLPGVSMAMFRLNRPGFIIYGGSMPPSQYGDRELDIVSAFEAYGELINHKIDASEYQEVIQNSCHRDCGSCSGLYTANTMAAILEVMGLTLPNSSSNPSQSDEKRQESNSAGDTISRLLRQDLKPLDIVDATSFKNAIALLYIMGGSTNAIIHLLAMAKTANVDLTLDDFKQLDHLPVILNMKPHGKHMMYHLHQNGGMSLLIKYLIENGVIDGEAMTITGKTLRENTEAVNLDQLDTRIIFPLETPFKSSSHINILKGNLAPHGCISKITSESKSFAGRAKVYDSQEEMITALEAGQITEDHFVIIRYQGETVGCPEMLKPTSALAGYFGNNNTPPLATDGRFSGGSHGILVCHLPDAYKHDNLTSIIEDGDPIKMDLERNTIMLEVSAYEISNRQLLAETRSPKLNGFLKKYSRSVSGIETGYLCL